ncbi:MAG TPA: laminin B domain-containing protein [Vicinamibacterales bacterium]|nr:laminin B domain-containing protein [Vicinamibacterales bacterium]
MSLAGSISLVLGALVCVMSGRAHSSMQQRTLAAHDFESSRHGWLVSGDTGQSEPRLHAAGGHPGGYISHVDEAVGETWYFLAPESVLTALRAAENGTLSYSLKQSAEIPGVLDDDVIIVGPAGRLSYRFPTSPGTGWTPFSVKLTAAAGWRWNWNAPATQEQIRRVLANATSLEIRGEYHTGPDEGGLDNVVVRAGG